MFFRVSRINGGSELHHSIQPQAPISHHHHHQQQQHSRLKTASNKMSNAVNNVTNNKMYNNKMKKTGNKHPPDKLMGGTGNMKITQPSIGVKKQPQPLMTALTHQQPHLVTNLVQSNEKQNKIQNTYPVQQIKQQNQQTPNVPVVVEENTTPIKGEYSCSKREARALIF